jgi:hypothetical protein
MFQVQGKERLSIGMGFGETAYPFFHSQKIRKKREIFRFSEIYPLKNALKIIIVA